MAGKAGRPSPPKDFESALAELETLVTGLETGKLTLEESLSHYRRGMELICFCQRLLDEAEQQVKILEAGRLADYAAGGGQDGAATGDGLDDAADP